MSALSDSVAGLVVSAQNMEARVTAHEAQDAATVATLQITITALQAQLAAATTPDPAVAQAVTDLTALKTSIDNFDVPAVAPAAVTPAAPAAPAA